MHGRRSCTESSSVSEHSSGIRGARLSPHTVPQYDYFVNQFPLCSDPNTVHMTMPRQSISAIEEEVPDTTVLLPTNAWT